MTQTPEPPLAPYRVLDLTEGGLNLGGKLLADLGADVIRVEPPGGSATRCRGPFYKDEAHPERSLFWFAYNVNKRGVTLDISKTQGRALFLELVRTTDVLLDSCPPCHLANLGLAQADLMRENPGLVRVSITPFGADGPYSGFQATDLIMWAMSGLLYLSGDEERAPVRVSVPFAEAVAGSHACSGALHALWYRNRTGQGQQVDLTQQVSAVWTNMAESPHGALFGTTLKRQGEFRHLGYTKLRQLYRCRDGYINYFTMEASWGAPFNRRLARWMIEEGVAPDYFQDFDWEHWSPASKLRRGMPEEALEDVRRVEEPFARFFLGKNKDELFRRALLDKLLLAPVMTSADLFEWDHLAAREFWTAVDHPELSASVYYPGPFAKLSESPLEYSRRAPLIGEHNKEVYEGELGHGFEELARWQAEGVI